MKNGYVLASEEGLAHISDKIETSTDAEIDALRGLLRVGIQWNTEVTLNDEKNTLTQVYCSALPVAYSPLSAKNWEKFAQLILEASYEATFCAGILNYLKTGNKKLYLTLIGGGVFGNDIEWIMNAIKRSLNLYSHFGLEVIIVSYGHSNNDVQNLIRKFK